MTEWSLKIFEHSKISIIVYHHFVALEKLYLPQKNDAGSMLGDRDPMDHPMRTIGFSIDF